MILMCGNNPVLDLETFNVLSKNLLPGILRDCQNIEMFKKWFGSRYSSPTNTDARNLRGLTFKQGNRSRINEVTKSLSLSDSYWIIEKDSTVLFEEVSPYYTPFWGGVGVYENISIPTLYVDGYLPKYWESANWLVKRTTAIEVACFELCKQLGLSVAEVRLHPDGIAVRNFTSPEVMFESATASGQIDPDEFTDIDIYNLFGKQGFTMILLDTIIGNGDRHTGNFGFLRNTVSGEYLGMAPLFDFDHALDTKDSLSDILITDVVDWSVSWGLVDLAIQLTSRVTELATHPMFIKRASEIMRRIRSSAIGSHKIKPIR